MKTAKKIVEFGSPLREMYRTYYDRACFIIEKRGQEKIVDDCGKIVKVVEYEKYEVSLNDEGTINIKENGQDVFEFNPMKLEVLSIKEIWIQKLSILYHVIIHIEREKKH